MLSLFVYNLADRYEETTSPDDKRLRLGPNGQLFISGMVLPSA